MPPSQVRVSGRHGGREPLATQDEVAGYLRVPPKTLEQWRWRKTGPQWSKVGRHVRYAWADVEEWFATQQGARV